MDPEHARPVFVPRGAGTVLGPCRSHMLTSDQTEGSCYLFESTFGPGEGNRMHRHQREDEIGYVVEGALDPLGEGSRILETGGIARLPKGIPHAIRTHRRRRRDTCSSPCPRASTTMVRRGRARDRDGSLDDAGLDALAREYGIDWLE